MRIKELLLAGLAYLLGVTAIYFVVAGRLDEEAVGVSQVGGTVLGVYVAVWLYQSENEQLAPARVKLAVGGTLATLCVLQGLVFQQLLQWTAYPGIAIFFGALGAIGFPFVLWNTFGKTVIDYRRR